MPQSGALDNKAFLDAARTRVHVFAASIDISFYTLQIRQPASLRQIMRVAHLIADHGAFPANIASFSHGNNSFSIRKLKDTKKNIERKVFFAAELKFACSAFD